MDDRETVLVTGGAGYVGSHMVWTLADAGWGAVVLDDLSAGARAPLPASVEMVVGDAGDRRLVENLIARRGCIAVLHFAGSVSVEESVRRPLEYFANNVGTTRRLLEACITAGVDRFIYSSSAAVYGDHDGAPIGEEASTRPVNPYGHSKLAAEWMIRDAAQTHGLGCAILRYFNVAGADPQVRTGQPGSRATHLIKTACQAALGRRQVVEVFGDDYDTPDGTCVRDYIHVSDLVDAHLLALTQWQHGAEPLLLNCGYGRGASVRQVLAAVEAEAGVALPIRPAPRRAGDAPSLVADARRIRDVLGWRPRHDDLGAIVRTALAWERNLAALEQP